MLMQRHLGGRFSHVADANQPGLNQPRFDIL